MVTVCPSVNKQFKLNFPTVGLVKEHCHYSVSSLLLHGVRSSHRWWSLFLVAVVFIVVLLSALVMLILVGTRVGGGGCYFGCSGCCCGRCSGRRRCVRVGRGGGLVALMVMIEVLVVVVLVVVGRGLFNARDGVFGSGCCGGRGW